MFQSIRKHLERPTPELTQALVRFGQGLLRSVRVHAPRTDEEALRQLQEGLLALERGLGERHEAGEVETAGSEAARLLETYSAAATRHREVRDGELQSAMAMLTQTVAEVTSAFQHEQERLSRLEREVQGAIAGGSAGEWNGCLQTVREEVFHQRKAGAETILALQRNLLALRNGLAAERQEPRKPLRPDAVTQLPGRADAEDDLAQSRQRGNVYAAVLPVDGLELVNQRFGPEAMDAVVRHFADYLRQNLGEEDRLYRWCTGAFLACVERREAADTVRAELARFASAKLEMALAHHGKEILLPLRSTWVLFAAGEGRSLAALTGKIDGFLGSEMHVKDSF